VCSWRRAGSRRRQKPARTSNSELDGRHVIIAPLHKDTVLSFPITRATVRDGVVSTVTRGGSAYVTIDNGPNGARIGKIVREHIGNARDGELYIQFMNQQRDITGQYPRRVGLRAAPDELAKAIAAARRR
jgi:hypothetical protein